MASVLPAIAVFHKDDIRTIAFGQSTKLDCRLLSRMVGVDGARFSGELTLYAAGGSMNDYFSLDDCDGVIGFTCNTTSFCTETLVHIGDTCIGSYIDLGVGPYLNMSLRNASLEQAEVLLQSIRFTAASNALLPDHSGLRIITVELREEDSEKKVAMQNTLEVLSQQP